jgi:hypothetical protein
MIVTKAPTNDAVADFDGGVEPTTPLDLLFIIFEKLPPVVKYTPAELTSNPELIEGFDFSELEFVAGLGTEIPREIHERCITRMEEESDSDGDPVFAVSVYAAKESFKRIYNTSPTPQPRKLPPTLP